MTDGTSHYLDCQSQIDRLNAEIMKLDKNSTEFTLWLNLTRLLGSLCSLIGVIFSDLREVKNLQSTSKVSETIESLEDMVQNNKHQIETLTKFMDDMRSLLKWILFTTGGALLLAILNLVLHP